MIEILKVKNYITCKLYWIRLSKINIFIGNAKTLRKQLLRILRTEENLITNEVETLEEYKQLLTQYQNKQLAIVINNPLILDEINMKDDNQRLFVIDFNVIGELMINRIPPPKPLEGQEEIKLSDAFKRGYIGGLREEF